MTGETRTLLIVGAITLAIIGGGAYFLSKGGGNPSNVSKPVSDASLLVRNDSNKIATSSAKVTVVEFGDFECPACAASEPVVKQVLNDYNGKVNFVFRNFPLPQHPNAMPSAEAAEAAGAQGKYFDMYFKLYENQNAWANLSNPTDTFVSYAKDLGLDVNKFKDDISNKKYQNKINGDLNDGTALGIDATPTFYINGQKLLSGYGYQDFKSLIDSELAK